jgi:hypothetical protein
VFFVCQEGCLHIIRKRKRVNIFREDLARKSLYQFGFLDLSEADVRYIEMKLALSRQLRLLRERRRSTQNKADALLKTSQSRLARMEAGDPSVSLDLLVRGLFALGGSSKDLLKAA